MVHIQSSAVLENHLFEIDIANCGTDITSLPEFKWADVVHLNWINQGMLSLRNIRKIVKSGKPVVWTMHDMWQATGICHYSGGCMSYKTGCAGCPLLPDGGSRYDLSNKIWRRKKLFIQPETYALWLAAGGSRVRRGRVRCSRDSA